jgi:uncharacterized protein YegJ (DUF2314 family)
MKWVLVVIAVLVTLHFTLMALGRRSLQERAVELEDDDPRMLAAVEQARATADGFIARLREPSTGQTSAAVKMRLEEDEVVEHVWLANPRFEDDYFVGRLDNDLINIKRWRAGDTLRVPRENLSDWLIIESGQLRGGYSIRLLRDLMSPDARRRFDRSAGFTISDQ